MTLPHTEHEPESASRSSAGGSRSSSSAAALAVAAGALVAAATALGAAHARGIVHRDIKPDNVFLVPEPEAASGERVKLLDFGIAKLTDEGPGSWSQTRTGAVLGTPSYMAPEQCAGAGNVDHRADLYSLGCILFEMLSGRPPFVGGGAGEIIGMHQFVPAPRLRACAPGVSRDADDIVALLLAKRPDERVQSAGELVRMLGARGGVKSTGSHHHIAVGTTGEISSTTTLGGAATPVAPTVTPLARRRRWPIVAAAMTAVGAGIVAMLVAGGGGGAGAKVAATPAAAVDAGAVAPAVSVDGGAIDAGAVDAGAIDAGAVDAGAIDARPSGPRKVRPPTGEPKPPKPELIEVL